jgi:hypothetical protein
MPIKYRVALARLEEVIGVLRDHSAIKGGKFDATGAETALRYFRRLARGGRDMAKEQEPAFAFIYDHESLDWIVYGNARGMICRLATG